MVSCGLDAFSCERTPLVITFRLSIFRRVFQTPAIHRVSWEQYRSAWEFAGPISCAYLAQAYQPLGLSAVTMVHSQVRLRLS